jgi:ABC-type sugar transport system ATPase subunit
VLEADVKIDRREFTVGAAIAVAPGERLALFGPSGAGKSTLLEAIAGLVQPHQGHITLAGRLLTSTQAPSVAVPAWRREVGLLRQNPGLFPHLTVRANLDYGRRGGTGPDGELDELARALEIDTLLGAMPARLSGGQQHRVALGRLLLAHCRALLLDEPYAGLDAPLRRTLTALVVRQVTEREVPAVLVAHELADAQAFAHRMAVLDRGEVLQVGGPDEVVLRPASRRVAELVGYLGFVPLPGGRTAGIHPDRVLAGARPDRGLVLTGQLAGSRPAGAGWEADLYMAGVMVTCRLAQRPVTSDGELDLTALDPPQFGADGTAIRGAQPVTMQGVRPAGWAEADPAAPDSASTEPTVGRAKSGGR